jgi:glutamyl-tRNA synthetase
MSEVRVRFAPSPTGYLHVGGARTALYNWLMARHHGGTLILRIEDTDRTRFVEDSLDDLMEGLKWLGLEWDEGPEVGGDVGPYVQSERTGLYRDHTDRLVEGGAAYRCFCPPERLKELREGQMERKERVGYDRRCRDLPEDEIKKNLECSASFVVRLRTPTEGFTEVRDEIRGEIRVDNRELEDLILLKSDGLPTYHLANVVDDHHMRISHVLRADEWISSTPYHVLLYKAFGWEPPAFGHLPIILAPDGKGKVSKRHGATSLREFRAQGYLPEALFNFLALLGWSPGDDREILSKEELIQAFDLSAVGKKGSAFDFEKLGWMNGEYIRMKDDLEIYELVLPRFQEVGLVESSESEVLLKQLIPHLKVRAKLLSDFVDGAVYFFKDDFEYEEKGLEKQFKEPAEPLERLARLQRKVQDVPEAEFKAQNLEALFQSLAEELGIKWGLLIHPMRVVLSGRTYGPGLFEMMEVLGKEKCLERMERMPTVVETWRKGTG